MTFLYIDPGSGSWLVQAIIAVVLAAGYGIRGVRHTITTWFSRWFGSKTK